MPRASSDTPHSQQFANLTTDSSCNDGDIACIQGSFAQCDHGAFVVQPCSTGTVLVPSSARNGQAHSHTHAARDHRCTALPLALSPGTTVTCTTPADRDARIAATGATPLSSGSSASSGATGSATSSAVSRVDKSEYPECDADSLLLGSRSQPQRCCEQHYSDFGWCCRKLYCLREQHQY